MGEEVRPVWEEAVADKKLLALINKKCEGLTYEGEKIPEIGFHY